MPKVTPSKRNKPCEDCKKRKVKCCIEPGQDVCVMCRMRSIPCSFKGNHSIRAVSSSSLSPSTYQSSITDDQLRTIHSQHPSALDNPITLSVWDGRSARFIGASGDYDPLTLKHCAFSMKDSCWTFSHVRKLNSDTVEPIYFQLEADNYEQIRAETLASGTKYAQSMVHPYEDVLLKIYFQTYDKVYPILWKSRIVERHSGKNTVPGALLLAIYLAAVQFGKDDERLCGWTPPTNASMRNVLKTMIEEELQQPRLATLQAILIYLRLPTGSESGFTSDAWQMTCAGFSLAQELGLYLDPSDWHIPAWEKKYRKRLWWMLFIAEKWGSLALGRTSHIDDAEYTVTELCISDFVENESSPSHDQDDLAGWTGVIGLAKLSVILSRILKTFYSVKRILVQESDILVIVNSLSDWRRRYLPPLQAFNSEKSVMTCTRIASIHLMSHTVSVSFYRGLMRLDRLGEQDREMSFLSLQCVTSLLQQLPTGQIDAYWPSFSRINLAIISTFLVKLVVNSVGETQYLEGIESLTAMSEALQRHQATWPAARLATQRLDLFTAGMAGADTSAMQYD